MEQQPRSLKVSMTGLFGSPLFLSLHKHVVGPPHILQGAFCEGGREKYRGREKICFGEALEEVIFDWMEWCSCLIGYLPEN